VDNVFNVLAPSCRAAKTSADRQPRVRLCGTKAVEEQLLYVFGHETRPGSGRASRLYQRECGRHRRSFAAAAPTATVHAC
jgi:hypothetical protein